MIAERQRKIQFLQCASHWLGAFPDLISLLLTASLWVGCPSFHFTGENTEVQRS